MIGQPSEPTYSVSELCLEVRDFLGEAFSSLWVAGEVQRVNRSRRGHVYFELVEKGAADDIVGKLDAVLWRSDRQRVERLLAPTGQSLEEGITLRCRGGVDFYPAGGRLQFVVREVDPVFSLGELERRRRETLAALEALGILEANRGIPLSPVPLSIGLVTSEGSAAYHDFLSTLSESGLGFQILFVHASVQGRAAESEVASALEALAEAPVDAVALIRGGGSRSDLAVFDGRRVAHAVASSPKPVITGLGHQIDRSIADLVAHTALGTPTKVAEHLIATVLGAEREVERRAASLARHAQRRLERARESLAGVRRGLGLAGLSLAGPRARLEALTAALARAGRGRLGAAEETCAALGRRLGPSASSALARRREAPVRLAERIARAAQSRLQLASARLDGIERLTAELAPERVLERGFSLTRDARGQLVTRADTVAAGERVVTQTADGSFASRVEE